jgi:hypothetical protein
MTAAESHKLCRVVTWAMIFMLVILKIPIAYLCAVIWWAIKAEPKPEAPAALVPAVNPDSSGPRWQRSPGPRRRPPRRPARRPAARRASARGYIRR